MQLYQTTYGNHTTATLPKVGQKVEVVSRTGERKMALIERVLLIGMETILCFTQFESGPFTALQVRIRKG